LWIRARCNRELFLVSQRRSIWHSFRVRGPPLRFVWILLGVIAGAVALFQWRNYSQCPGGLSLEQWVQRYLTLEDADQSTEAAEVRTAIRRLGCRALPELIKCVAYDPAPRRQRVSRWAKRLPETVRHSSLMRLMLVDRNETRANTAAAVLQVLGPDAVPAAGELTRLMESTNSTLVSRRAIWTLAHMGAEGVAPLQTLFTNIPHPNRLFAIDCLPLLGTNGLRAVPALTGCLEDADPLVRLKATNALNQIVSPRHPLAPEL